MKRSLEWNAYADDDTDDFLWLYPIEHLNDVETLSSTESRIEERIQKEHWDAGSDLHESVDHSEEFVVRDEPSLSRLPPDLDSWTWQFCEFRLYYTSGGYGGSDTNVCKLWRNYRAVFPPEDTGTRYRLCSTVGPLGRRSANNEIKKRIPPGLSVHRSRRSFGSMSERSKSGGFALIQRCRFRESPLVQNPISLARTLFLIAVKRLRGNY
jgi:hypothetical protein